MRRRALLLVVTLVTALVTAVWPVLAGPAGNQASATAADDARRRVDSFSVIGMPRIDALMTLAHQHRVPLGIEYAGPELFTPVTLHLDDTDVGTAISALFPASLGFRVALDGAVPVIRHAALPPASANAIDVVLPRLVILRRMSMPRAASQVWMTLASQLDPTIGGVAGSELGMPEERVPPTTLVRVSAREALNRLARADGRGVWFVTVPPAGLDRRWTKEDPPMWSATQYDYSSAASVGRQIAARMPDIVPRDGRGSAAPVPRVGVTPFSPRKIKHVDPVYPSAVIDARTDQIVVLELRINQEGRVENARILRSVPSFDQAALDAARQWEYEPLLLNGLPTRFTLSVTVNFTPSSNDGRVPAQPIPRPVR
jgi:TonB family protein